MKQTAPNRTSTMAHLLPAILLAIMGRGCTAFHAPNAIISVGAPSSSQHLRVVKEGGRRRLLFHSSLFPSTPFRMSASNADTNGDDDDDEIERLRETASKLRAEAQEAEKALEGTRSTGEGTTYVKPVEYIDLRDSCWEITYRFANEPEYKNDEDVKNKPPRKYYSGKVQLQFKNDGYTDILSSAIEDNINNNNAAVYQKVWGWDIETSGEDSLDYLLFSADITLPPPISTSERFYFQARVDKDDMKKDVLSLEDGSVTVKRNYSEAPTGGWWGIFRGADSILAQFREVGGFKCRPVAKPEQ